MSFMVLRHIYLDCGKYRKITKVQVREKTSLKILIKKLISVLFIYKISIEDLILDLIWRFYVNFEKRYQLGQFCLFWPFFQVPVWCPVTV